MSEVLISRAPDIPIEARSNEAAVHLYQEQTDEVSDAISREQNGFSYAANGVLSAKEPTRSLEEIVTVLPAIQKGLFDCLEGDYDPQVVNGWVTEQTLAKKVWKADSVSPAELRTNIQGLEQQIRGHRRIEKKCHKTGIGLGMTMSFRFRTDPI